MPADVKVSTYSFDFEPYLVNARPIEFGVAINESVSLLGIKYNIETVTAHMNNDNFMVALSSDPGHIANPPANINALFRDKSIYAMWSRLFTVVGPQNYTLIVETKCIDLYGLIRPKRQVLLTAFWRETLASLQVEIYWQQLSRSIEETATTNRKYGKYRRT